LAREVRLKRFGPTPPENFKERARQMRFLQYRGFELTQINGALDLEDVSD
jgi:regulatory protein